MTDRSTTSRSRPFTGAADNAPASSAAPTQRVSLVQSVNRHELSEPEAQRKWIEFRTARADVERQLAAAAAAASASTTCNKIGNTVTCF